MRTEPSAYTVPNVRGGGISTLPANLNQLVFSIPIGLVRLLVSFLFVFLYIAAAYSQEPTPSEKPIRLPVVVDDTPNPPIDPRPRPVTTLPEDYFFVVESDLKLIVLHSPDGLLNVTEDPGPIRLRGKFAGSTGKVETRAYTSAFVYTIEGKKAGQTELILIPQKVENVDQIVRTMLSVHGAQPPPDPDPKPDPDPAPKPTSGKVRLDIVEEAEERVADTAVVLNALVTWSEFTEKGNEWRIYDKETTEPKGLQAVKDIGDTPVPAMVIRDKEKGTVLRVLPLPKTWDTFQRLVKEVAGE